MDSLQIANCIDHTLLKAETTGEMISALCLNAIKHNFYSVCINPSRVKEATEYLSSSKVKVCSVIGFPLGATSTMSKLEELEFCIINGATEIDMVINIGYFKDGNLGYVSNEISKIVKNAPGNIIKAIIETALLNNDEIIKASKLVEDSGAHFVKTSTGYSELGATTQIVSLIRNSVNSEMGIKASGGINSLSQVKELLLAGANRIGTSSGINIMNELP